MTERVAVTVHLCDKRVGTVAASLAGISDTTPEDCTAVGTPTGIDQCRSTH